MSNPRNIGQDSTDHTFAHNDAVVAKAMQMFESELRRRMGSSSAGSVGIRVPIQRGRFGNIRIISETEGSPDE